MSAVDRVASDAGAIAHPYFVVGGWKYGWASPRVPDEVDLVDVVRYLVDRVRTDSDAVRVESGRFRAKRGAGGAVEVWFRGPDGWVLCGVVDAEPEQ